MSSVGFASGARIFEFQKAGSCMRSFGLPLRRECDAESVTRRCPFQMILLIIVAATLLFWHMFYVLSREVTVKLSC